jgi:hypothetical protein
VKEKIPEARFVEALVAEAEVLAAEAAESVSGEDQVARG